MQLCSQKEEGKKVKWEVHGTQYLCPMLLNSRMHCHESWIFIFIALLHVCSEVAQVYESKKINNAISFLCYGWCMLTCRTGLIVTQQLTSCTMSECEVVNRQKSQLNEVFHTERSLKGCSELVHSISYGSHISTPSICIRCLSNMWLTQWNGCTYKALLSSTKYLKRFTAYSPIQRLQCNISTCSTGASQRLLAKAPHDNPCPSFYTDGTAIRSSLEFGILQKGTSTCTLEGQGMET